MKVQIYGCKACGNVIKVLDGQAVIRCHYCDAKLYIFHDFPKIVVLKPDIEPHDAKRRIFQAFHHRSVDRAFIRDSVFEKATLYFIPFFEVRGIRTGWISPPGTGVDEYGYRTFNFLEKANDLKAMKIGLVDHAAVEESILNAIQIPFDMAEMRKQGVVLPYKQLEYLKKEQFQPSGDVVESHCRIVYFPVWEVGYSYRGIIFKSYLSAVDGRILEIHALRNHQMKLILAIGGLFGLATLLSRSFKMAFIMKITPFFGFSFVFLIILLPLLLVLSALLFPYLWRLYAFQEELVIRGKWTESSPINYTENRLLRFSRVFSDRFTRLFDFGERG